jgi:hypothetical protein
VVAVRSEKTGAAPPKSDYVADLIREISASITPGVPDEFGIWFSKRDEGSLFLSGEEARHYSQVVSRLKNEYAKAEELSRRSIEGYLQAAIFAALDLQARSAWPFERRLSDAVRELRKKLAEPLIEFTACVPVGGLSSEGLPWTFGGIRLEAFSEKLLSGLERAAGRELASLRQGNTLDHLKATDGWGKPSALVQVRAKDAESATRLAAREARRLVDILNFFADLVPFNHAWAYLPEEAAPVRVAVPLIASDGTDTTYFVAQGPLGDFSLKKLREAGPLRPSLRKVDALMRGAVPGSYASVILSAMQWAGRASAEPVREKKFLLFAIALETLMLPGNTKDELTYRLKVRVAHLLGGSAAQRAELAALIGHLYDRRSAVVHAGSYEVTDEDLGRLRSITKACIVRTLVDRRLSQLATVKQVVAWFDNRVLS